MLAHSHVNRYEPIFDAFEDTVVSNVLQKHKHVFPFLSSWLQYMKNRILIMEEMVPVPAPQGRKVPNPLPVS